MSMSPCLRRRGRPRLSLTLRRLRPASGRPAPPGEEPTAAGILTRSQRVPQEVFRTAATTLANDG